MGKNQAILRILHLSDLHFTCSKKQGDKWAVNAFNEQMVNRSMLAAIEQLTCKNICFDLIIITGDIAFSGKSDEYEVAGLFFKELLEKTKLDKNRLFLIPGNHDVDRDEIDEILGKSIYTYSSQDEISGILMHRTLFPLLMNKFLNFFHFADNTMGYHHYAGDSFFYVEHTTIVKNSRRFLINLAGLNSALFSKDDKDKERKLALGIYQVDKVINQLDKTAILNIGFFHHPFACLHDMEKGTKNRLIQAMDFILTGHLHEPEPSFSHTAAGKAVIIGAGASYKKGDALNSFDIIEIDLLTGKGHVQFYKYLPTHNEWKKNTDVNPHVDDGSFPFEINLKKHKPGPGESAGPTGNPSRYLRYLHDECAYINIRGIVTQAKHAYQFNIDDFYIPLATASGSAGKTGKENSLFREKTKAGMHIPASEISLDRALTCRRVTIIGDPGSGKTTYIRRISYLLAMGLLKDDDRCKKLGLEKGAFPLFIRIDELCRYISLCRETKRTDCPRLDDSPNWLVHFLDEKNKELQWELPEDFFKQKLKSSATIVLLDGLDEAPDSAARENVSRILHNAIIAWPECRYVVTTRPHAYKGTIILEKFEEYTIASLQETAVESFLLKWAQALNRESILTTTVDNYYNELKNALQGRPAIKRMTGNPIMLTALAVVHWNERKLPEGRANLYHSIITWLLLSRKDRPGRLSSDACRAHLQHLALAMQMHPEGRQVNVGRRWAAEQLYTGFTGSTDEERIKKAERFLEEEEVDSGIIVSRGNNITFWHLTFQEYLAALALGGKMESEQIELLITPEILHNPSWREVILLFGGVLYNQGKDKIDGFLSAILNTAETEEKTLADEAQCVGLLGCNHPRHSVQYV